MTVMEDIKNSKAVRVYRQGWLAWLGAHKAAFDMAQDGVKQVLASRQQFVDDLVEKGESVEGLAKENFDKVRGDVETRFNEVSEKVTAASNKVLGRTAEVAADPVAELTEEVAKLAKTVGSLDRKVTSLTKPAAKKAPVKKAAPKAAAPKAAAPKAAAKEAAAPKADDAKSAA